MPWCEFVSTSMVSAPEVMVLSACRDDRCQRIDGGDAAEYHLWHMNVIGRHRQHQRWSIASSNRQGATLVNDSFGPFPIGVGARQGIGGSDVSSHAPAEPRE